MLRRRSPRATARLDRIRQQWTPAPTPPTTPPRIRLGPWRPSAWRGFAALTAGAVLLAGWWWWSGRPGDVVLASDVIESGVVLDAVDTGPVIVHVLGAVRRPGLIELPSGARVADAITAAGGATDEQALGSVNLARLLVDGEQVFVDPTGEPTGGGPDGSGAISLNQASAAELQTLPGIGPVLADRIVAWRTSNGPFRSIDELAEVSGIGNAVMAQVRPLLRL
jgi:competence protein ComEA